MLRHPDEQSGRPAIGRPCPEPLWTSRGTPVDMTRPPRTSADVSSMRPDHLLYFQKPRGVCPLILVQFRRNESNRLLKVGDHDILKSIHPPPGSFDFLRHQAYACLNLSQFHDGWHQLV